MLPLSTHRQTDRHIRILPLSLSSLARVSYRAPLWGPPYLNAARIDGPHACGVIVAAGQDHFVILGECNAHHPHVTPPHGLLDRACVHAQTDRHTDRHRRRGVKSRDVITQTQTDRQTDRHRHRRATAPTSLSLSLTGTHTRKDTHLTQPLSFFLSLSLSLSLLRTYARASICTWRPRHTHADSHILTHTHCARACLSKMPLVYPAYRIA
jgi:hypothetical protein